MYRALACHPASPAGPVLGVEATAHRTAPGVLTIGFVVHGDISAVLLPPGRPPTREDNLWKHTCFEAFVQAHGSHAYCEWNLSPSAQWAAYAFDRYREGMRNQAGAVTPWIETHAEPRRYELKATIDVSEAPLPRDVLWSLGLTAVVETAAGLSYWALAHPAPKPDFHNAAGFVYEAPPAETS